MPLENSIIATPAPATASQVAADDRPFELAFENAPIGMALLGADGRVICANRAMCEMLGVADAQLRTRSLVDFAHPDDAAAANAQCAQLRSGELESYNAERRYVHADGRVVVSQVWCSVVRDAQGQASRFIVQLQDATERILAERMLRESEQRFRSLTMLTNDWYWEQDEHFRFTSSSSGEEGAWLPDFYRGGPSQAGKFIGRCRWEQPGVTPLSGDWSEHKATLQAHQPFRDFEYVRNVPGEPPRYVSSSGEPLFDADGRFRGYRGTARDISASKIAEAKLREAESLLHMAAQMGRLGGWTYEVERDCVIWSEEVCAMHEVPRGFTMKSERCLDYYAPAFRGRMYRLLKACLDDGTPFDVEVRGLTAKGRTLWVRVIGEAQWDAQGKVTRLLGALQDITESRNASERLNAELEERVRQRTAELEQANKDLESFSYSIAHDLRAPLSSIDGFSHRLQEAEGAALGETSQHYLRRVRAGVRQMSELTDGLLTLSSLSKGELVRLPLDLAAMAGTVVRTLREQSPGREVQVDIESPLEVIGDPRLVPQLVSNLLANAWKFTREAPQPRIAMGRVATQEPGPPVFFVRDNGAGFDMAYASRLFQAFHRLHTPAEFEGNGVGLAIAGKIVARHGGRIWAESAPGAGATFWFTLG